MIHQIIQGATRFFQKRSKKSSKEHFYLNKIYFKRTSFLYKLFLEKKAEGKVFKTDDVLRPLGLTFQASYKEVLKGLSKVSFAYDNENTDRNHKVLFVRQILAELNILVQLQFYDDQLFFVSLDLSRNLKHDSDKTFVINTIIEKYLKKPFEEGDEYPVIEDAEGNFIVINDDVNFSICYYGNNLKQAYTNLKTLANHSRSPFNAANKAGLFNTF